MSMRTKWLVLVLVVGLVVAACGDGDEGATTTEAAATETTAAAAPETTEAAAETTEATTAATEAPAEILTDVGVDLEAGTITVGLLTDLTGVFAFLVQPIVDAYQAYFDDVNANGGINGLQVEIEVFDTSYQADQTVLGYEELKDEVVAFGHSVGSPQTVGIQPDLEADGILAVPLTWYSGWTDPRFSSNLIHHGAPYCIEAMNIFDYLTQEFGTDLTVAIASLPGDYGLDSAAGAKLAAEALGLEVVLDLSGQIIPGEDMKTTIADPLSESGADVIFVTTEPNLTFPAIYQEAIANEVEAIWTGAAPTYSTAFLVSDFAEEFAGDWYGFTYFEPWSGTSEGAQAVRDLIAEYRPDLPPFDYYGEGVVEARILHEGLLTAYENGDMTQSGVLAAVKSFEALEFDGLAPPERYTGTPNEQLQRVGHIVRPDLEDLAAGGSGTVILESNFSGPTAQAYEFTEACFSLG